MGEWSPLDPPAPPEGPRGPRLLAVDLGLRTGLAVFERRDAGVRLLRYRSQNYGSPARLKRGAFAEVSAEAPLEALVVEGDTQLARAWTQPAARRGARVRVCQAHDWRPALLLPRERERGAVAKRSADGLARAIIDASGAPKPTALRHDAAEAICIGWW
ncbi:MAG: hypothetical protein AAGH15_24895, partial [Myxococcota bacterium]